jgi:hypothetical protein
MVGRCYSHFAFRLTILCADHGRTASTRGVSPLDGWADVPEEQSPKTSGRRQRRWQPHRSPSLPAPSDNEAPEAGPSSWLARAEDDYRERLMRLYSACIQSNCCYLQTEAVPVRGEAHLL